MAIDQPRNAIQPDIFSITATWDPGGRPRHPNDHLRMIISSSSQSSDDPQLDLSVESRTELDTHSNMPVVGRHALVIADLDETIDVNPFTPDYDAIKVKLVDAAIRYDCPFSGTQYLLLIKNALYVPSIDVDWIVGGEGELETTLTLTVYEMDLM